MRFKTLPSFNQNSLAARWAAFVRDDAEPGVFPIVPVATWLAAFRAVNPRILYNGLPAMDRMEDVATWVDEYLHGPAPAHGTCSCCGTSF